MEFQLRACQPPNDVGTATGRTATRWKLQDGDDVTGAWDYDLNVAASWGCSVASKFSFCLREILRCFRSKLIRQCLSLFGYSCVCSGIGTVVLRMGGEL